MLTRAEFEKMAGKRPYALMMGKDALQLHIYTNVEGDGYDFWTGEEIKSETSANYFRQQLESYPDVSQIDVYINSLGGSCFEGNSIYAQLKRHPAHKTVYIDGSACSIASVIAMAGDTVVMARNSIMMIHNAWCMVDGNSAELRKAADQLDKLNAAARQAYLAKSNGKIDEKQLIKLMEAETYLTAAECLHYGFADEITDGESSLDMDLQGGNVATAMYAERLAAVKAAANGVAVNTSVSAAEQVEPKAVELKVAAVEPKQEIEPKSDDTNQKAAAEPKADFYEKTEKIFKKFMKV